MITLDRSSSKPVHEQLAEQLRYLIASGQFKVDEILPSTRALAEQIGVSFHTVRKAYQQLEEEGLLRSRAGSGYRVIERSPLEMSERMERGAAVLQGALQRLIGLGLEEQDLEYLFHEQLSLHGHAQIRHKLVFAAPFRELATLCAEQAARFLQQPVEAALLTQLEPHLDADYIITRFIDVKAVKEVLPRSDVVGVMTMLSHDALDRIARLLAHETLALITRFADAIPPLLKEIQTLTGFQGQIIAAPVEEGTRHFSDFLDQANLIAYTPGARRRLLSHLKDVQQHVRIEPSISAPSLEALQKNVPK